MAYALAELLRRSDLAYEAKPRAAPLLRLPAELAPKARAMRVAARRCARCPVCSLDKSARPSSQALRLAETVVAYQAQKADDEAVQKLLRDVLKRPELRVRATHCALVPSAASVLGSALLSCPDCAAGSRSGA